MERTLAILKPDCVQRRLVGHFLLRLEEAGFTIRAMRLRRLTREQAETFYAVHRGKHFFDALIEFMTEGPCVTLILEADQAIERWRALLEELRAELSDHPTRNLAHGSDSPTSSAFECGYLFAGLELV